MKKILAILLVLVLALSLVGCGGDEAKKDREKAAEADKAAITKSDYKVKGMIDVDEENEDEVFGSLETLSEERLDELGDYFEKYKEETKGMSYVDLEKIIGLQGIHFPEQDEVIDDGSHVKYVFWYSEGRMFYGIFTASKDSPDDFGLDEAGIYVDTEENN